MSVQATFPKQFSFEFSAPRTPEQCAKVAEVHGRLAKVKPTFFSVTYGAGGSTKDGTKQAVLDIRKTGSDVAPHLSFGSDPAEKIENLLYEYRDAGVTRVVALRGDVPSGTSRSTMRYASELVSFIREKTGGHFNIEVAAYPEIHPDSKDVESDLHYFKEKVDAGANGALTQYFFNADAYFRYVDRCEKLGINIPIAPGIMPITNYANIVRFSEKCGAEIPRWIRKQMESYGDDTDSQKAFSTDLLTDMCRRLLEGGAPGIHFYTLNQSLACLRIWRNLGIEG